MWRQELDQEEPAFQVPVSWSYAPQSPELRFVVWIVLLQFLFGWNLLIRVWGLPADAPLKSCRAVEIAENMIQLTIFGSMQCLAMRLYDEERFNHMFCVHGPKCAAALLTVSPLYSAISNFQLQWGKPATRTSAGTTTPGPPAIAIYILLGLVLASLLCMHIQHARRKKQLTRLLTPALGLLSVLIAGALLVVSAGHQLHLHHYFIAWWLSLLAQFNTWWSMAMLLVCVSVFVQGVAS